MIFKDSRGYLVAESLDSGDSAVRAGLESIFTGHPGKILDYVLANGNCVRSPWQVPWNNPNNFTKDQLKCLVAGLVAIGRHDICELILQAHEARGYFCQNIERDAVGSIKLKRPHAFYKDSKPDTTTAAMKFIWSKFAFEPDHEKLDLSQIIETKMFDSADLMLPNDWEFLMVAAKRKEPGVFGLWFHMQSIKTHAKSAHNEENQMFAECYVLGTIQTYIETNSQFDKRGAKYWSDRNEIEYHLKMKQKIQEITSKQGAA